MPGRASTVSTTDHKVKTDHKAESSGKPKSVPASTRPAPATREEVQAAKSQAPTSVQPVEPEDAYLTGVSRSLQRRLLGLNVDGARPQAAPHPEAVAGQHATGSFTSSKPTSVPAKEQKRIRKS
jgi:hypothetical protein